MRVVGSGGRLVVVVLGMSVACATGADVGAGAESLSGNTPAPSADDDTTGEPDALDTGDVGDGTEDGTGAEPSPSDTGTTGDTGAPDDPAQPEDPEDPPPLPTCGDAIIDPGEQCDDGNAADDDACLGTCTDASCGDAIVYDGVEACDDGENEGTYGGCLPGCTELAPYCGDGDVSNGERCDPEHQLPFGNVDCDAATCVYDFGAIPQLYCNGTCSWTGNYGCDQADADVLCKLVTGDATSTASDYDLASTLHAPGFACPSYGVNMGTMPELGVNLTVWYQDFDLAATHGVGTVIVNPTCT